MQDSIQTQPGGQVIHTPPVATREVRKEEIELPVLPSNAEHLAGRATLHVSEAPTPVKSAKPTPAPPRKVDYGVPPLLAYPYVAPVQDSAAVMAADTLALPADTLALDSLALPQAPVEGEIKEGIILINPASAYRKAKPEQPKPTIWGGGMSWIYLGLILIFSITAVKFKGSSKYLKALLTDLTDTRVRHNVFDETVKETSLLVMLNVLWVASAGILLWVLLGFTVGFDPAASLSLPPDKQAEGIALCMAVVAVYEVLIFLAYAVVGNIFTDSKLTRLWVKGAGASSAMETFLLFPIALMALNYPPWQESLLIIAIIVFGLGKLVFLYKGFRIFFNQSSSWLLFLYYLCSLEIVPLILTYAGALWACTQWL
ncbi:MAG: DUF4271 domain-containing protein [Muribaculaceae bacterium]|nr:DUF4271 domain-containing protein [Muribaculaceae bacterium]